MTKDLAGRRCSQEEGESERSSVFRRSRRWWAGAGEHDLCGPARARTFRRPGRACTSWAGGFAALGLVGVLGGCALVGTAPRPAPKAVPPTPESPRPARESPPPGLAGPPWDLLLTGFPEGWTETGLASWYGHPYHGRPTASGEVYDQEAPTAAHRLLPFGTRLRVENLENGRAAQVTVNDRGPFVEGRILDVSRRIARELGLLGPGTARVRLTVLETPGPPRACWFLMAGVFEREREAQAHLARLEKEGLPGRVRVSLDGKVRVWAGPFRTLEELHRAYGGYGGMAVGC